jgi:hypothetical protein
MNKILFPTDFSESANNALAYAAKFASDNAAELVCIMPIDYWSQYRLKPIMKD